MGDKETIGAPTLLAKKTNGDEDLTDVVQRPREIGERRG
jgi:hypothetical protein